LLKKIQTMNLRRYPNEYDNRRNQNVCDYGYM
jgi:hypothetical protein